MSPDMTASAVRRHRLVAAGDVWVAHQKHCPAFADAGARCKCTPSWRGRRWNAVKRDSEWQKPVTKDRSEVLAWLGAGKKGAAHLRARASAGRTFESIGDEWIAGVAAGRIGRRKEQRSMKDWATSQRQRRIAKDPHSRAFRVPVSV
jgi:hypothetical protein